MLHFPYSHGWEPFKLLKLEANSEYSSDEHRVEDHWNSLSWALAVGIPVNVPQVYQDGTRAIALSLVMSDFTLVFPGIVNSSVIRLTLNSISHQGKRQLNWIHKLVSAWKQLCFSYVFQCLWNIWNNWYHLLHLSTKNDLKKKKDSTQMPAVRSD